MPSIRNAAKERLQNGELALGVGIRLVRTVEIAEVMKTAGFDFLFIDLEHGAMSIDTAVQMSVAALDVGIAPIVRVPSRQFFIATRVLDGGALGIVMPHVDSADEARDVVNALKYPPVGHRSVAGTPAQVDFKPFETGELTRDLNAATLVVVMLETPTAIANADEIAAVPGIDVLLIGTNDFCMESGIPDEFGHAKVRDAYERVIAACKKHGKWPGMGGVYTEDLQTRYVGMGARMILSGADLGFIMGAASRRSEFLRGLSKRA
jgi:4-hydroxy-2-oxoheptanedioate aldolase